MPEVRRWDLLAYGDPCLDLILEADALPPAGGKVLARSLGQSAGGTTANAACAMARLGGRTAVFGRVGGDSFGEFLRGSLREDGVNIEHLQTTPGQPSGLAIAMLPPGGDRALVVVPMPAAPPPFLTQRLYDAALHSRVIYAMPYELRELERIHYVAQRTATRIAIDLEPAVAGDQAAMLQRIALADLVFFNEAGFRASMGEDPSPQLLKALLAHGPSCIVVTLGAQGAMAADRNGVVRHGAFKVPVRDTTGAGDTFNAAFVLHYLEGESIAACLRFACAASSFVVRKVGARTGQPTRADVEGLLALG